MARAHRTSDVFGSRFTGPCRWRALLLCSLLAAPVVVMDAADAGATAVSTVSIGSASIVEGDIKQRSVTIPVTLRTSATSEDVVVAYRLVADTATGGRPTTPGADFNNRQGAAHTLTFRAGSAAVVKYVSVAVLPDIAAEGDETMHVELLSTTGGFTLRRRVGIVTIRDDETAATARVDIDDASVDEGSGPKRTAKFQVTLSEPQTTPVVVGYRVFPFSATGNYKYGPVPSGTDIVDRLSEERTITFSPNATGLTPVAKTIAVTVFADSEAEASETFAVKLTTVSPNVDPGDTEGLGTILDDDLEWAQLSGSVNNTCGVTTFGAAYCWGHNGFGQLGDGTTAESHIPVPVMGLTAGVTEITTGYEWACALTVAATAYCWGTNFAGQLGNGTGTILPTPTPQLVLLSGIKHIDAGAEEHTCAVTLSGDAYCWGDNSYGQLGDGTDGGSTQSPVMVTGLEGTVAQISAGLDHTCAVTTTGSAHCWGANSSGKLGIGSFDLFAHPTPLGVTGLGAGVAQVAAGDDHTCARTTAGGALCWGQSLPGALGAGAVTWSTTPVGVTGLGSGTAWIDVESHHSCARTTTGAAWCWGSGFDGELGDGSNLSRDVPVAVTGLGTSVTDIEAGWYHSCAIQSGAAYCWGYNQTGQLGDDTTSSSNLPRLVQ